MPAPLRSLHSARPTLKRGLWIFVSAALFVLWTLVLIFTHVYRNRLIDSATKELVQLNSVVAQHTFALFRQVETDLKIVDEWLQSCKTDDPLNDPHFISLTRQLHDLSNQLINIHLITASGQLHTIPDREHKAAASVADRSYFIRQQGLNRQTLLVGEPIQSRVNGEWIIPISWRLRQPVKGFEIAVAGIQLGLLTDPHEHWRMKEAGGILLVREDGVLLSRAPFNPRLLGMDLSKMPEYGPAHTKMQGHFITNSSSTDGVLRIASFERLQDMPLFIVVTRGLDEALTPYYELRHALLWSAGALSVLLLVFANAIRRTQKSLFAAQDKLQRLALIDDLTQVMNRRAFLEQAEREFSRARRQNEALAVLMIDVDHFKLINDHYGHATGDEVLNQLTQLWTQALRSNDLLGRLGGEEFCIALPNTQLEQALEIAQRLLDLSASAQVSALNPDLRVSISVGLAALQDQDEDWQHIAIRADQALYQAKESGRKRVEAAPE